MQPSGDRKVLISFRLEHLLGWGVTIALCIVPVILWLQIHPLSSIHGFPAIMLNLGRVTGLVGMVMYALNLVYMTRLKFLEYFFGGLNRVYIAHHLLGGFALIFLSLHPLFLALRYIKVSVLQSALLLLPTGLTPLNALLDRHSQYHNIVLTQWAIFFGIIAFWGMVGLLLVTFFIKIPYRVWLFTHRFLGYAFFIAGLHVLFISSDVTTHVAIRYYTLVLSGLGIVAFIYRSIMGRILIRNYRYHIDHVVSSVGGVTQLIMTPEKMKISYKPGQFVFIRFLNSRATGVSKEWHPFSISSSPKDDKLRISVKALGDYTTHLNQIKPGTVAEIEGAYGRFGYTNFGNKNQIWIGGGIGITPFISMARDLRPDDGFRIDLYYSVKTPNELINWQELIGIAELKNGWFRVIPFIGDQQKGHIDMDFVEKMSEGLKGKDIYICGPAPMMKSLRVQCKQKGIPGTSIHSEEFAMS